jgi:hypothetical protein
MQHDPSFLTSMFLLLMSLWAMAGLPKNKNHADNRITFEVRLLTATLRRKFIPLTFSRLLHSTDLLTEL